MPPSSSFQPLPTTIGNIITQDFTQLTGLKRNGLIRTASCICFPICQQIKYNANTKGRIIEKLAVKWINYRKHYYQICKAKKLPELSWKKIERSKYDEEEIPASNEFHDKNEKILMNDFDFDAMIKKVLFFKKLSSKSSSIIESILKMSLSMMEESITLKSSKKRLDSYKRDFFYRYQTQPYRSLVRTCPEIG
jgi:hypothetical protein